MDITLIPGVMRRLNWKIGARLMEIWFGRQPNHFPERGAPETQLVLMDKWVLKFRRAATVYNSIVSERAWCSEEAKRKIGDSLRQQGKLTSQRVTFGDLNLPVPQLDGGMVLERSVASSLLDDLDDMYAALGSFDLRVVVSGSVAPRQGSPTTAQAGGGSQRGQATARHDVRIERVGIYLRDSYDFNGEQPLGFWNDSGVSKFPLPFYDAVMNSDFRAWRSRSAHGGDFLVFSDMKVLPRNPPDSFTLP